MARRQGSVRRRGPPDGVGRARGGQAVPPLEWRLVNRFQQLAAISLATALGLVTIGVVVRATDSGLGCPDWPFCYGQILPPAGDFKAWIEWVHRTIAAVIGFEILGLGPSPIRWRRWPES